MRPLACAIVAALSIACSPLALASEEVVVSSNQIDCRTGCPIPEGAERVIFEGMVRKAKTSDPRVLGGARLLKNSTGDEYRIIEFEYTMDTSAIEDGETFESDIGFTILPPGVMVSLNSGEELLITHQYDAGPGEPEKQEMNVPRGGFVLPDDYSLSVGSVSGLFNPGQGVQEIDPSRLNDGDFMALHYRAVLVRADLVEEPEVTSYRSPYRDRSYVADGNRVYAPFTDFVNKSDEDVKLYGTGIFLSNLTSLETSSHTIEVRVNGEVVETINTPDHIPGKASQALPLVLPLDVTLKPNDHLSVRAKVLTPKALVFDYAAFVVGDVGLEPHVERLDVAEADFNGDGHDDFVDIDATGAIWVSLRVGDGFQNTQDAWINGIGKIDSMEPWIEDGKPVGLVARNNDGLCLNLKTRIETTDFLPGYCGQEIGDLSKTEVWGDFNGDGWPDRMQIKADTTQYMVSLGSKEGLQETSPWINGFGEVTQLFAFDGDEDGKTDLLTEWSDSTGFRCVVWRSTGTEFAAEDCP